MSVERELIDRLLRALNQAEKSEQFAHDCSDIGEHEVARQERRRALAARFSIIADALILIEKVSGTTRTQHIEPVCVTTSMLQDQH
jgi:hypothetical protein